MYCRYRVDTLECNASSMSHPLRIPLKVIRYAQALFPNQTLSSRVHQIFVTLTYPLIPLGKVDKFAAVKHSEAVL